MCRVRTIHCYVTAAERAKEMAATLGRKQVLLGQLGVEQTLNAKLHSILRISETVPCETVLV